MQFSDLYRSPRSTLSRLRPQLSLSTRPAGAEPWDPDLLSRDKEKQKAAVKRYVDAKVRSDWDFEWPSSPPDSSPPSLSPPSQPPQTCTKNQEDLNNENGNNSKGKDLSPCPKPDPAADAPSGGPYQAFAIGPDPALQPQYQVGQVSTGRAPPCARASEPAAPVLAATATPAFAPAPPPDRPRDPGYDAESDPSSSEPQNPQESESDYSTVSDDPTNFRTRTYWDSGDELDADDVSYPSSSPRFRDPDSVGTEVWAWALEKSARRRRELREEMQWNDGLTCFEARRDAWTGARQIRLKPSAVASPACEKAVTPLSPLSPRRLFMRQWSGTVGPGASPGAGPVAGARSEDVAPLVLQKTRSSDHSGECGDEGEKDGDGVFSLRETASKDTRPSSNSDNSEMNPAAAQQQQREKKKAKKAERLRLARERRERNKQYPVVSLMPSPPPLLPADNPMRASIGPGMYNSIFENIVLQGMVPGCPINLADMVSACVHGWKKRGEWPPQMAAIPEPALARRRAGGRDGLAMSAAARIEAEATRTRHHMGHVGHMGRIVGGLDVRRKEGQTQVNATSPQSTAAPTPLAAAKPAASEACAEASAPAFQNPLGKVQTVGVPRPAPSQPRQARRKSFAGFLTREKTREGPGRHGTKGTDAPLEVEEKTAMPAKTFKKSLQKVLGWGHHHHHHKGYGDGGAGTGSGSGGGVRGGMADPAPAVMSRDVAMGQPGWAGDKLILVGGSVDRNA